ncbi:MAG: CaiB/BaiF CoA-transferase family protein [Nocardioides sp.]|uniref:CaiB/BaiF CoA transferase family protein n=1 Tax=Nocardioides sp. TaxID=35761 RepID=UPI0039E47086
MELGGGSGPLRGVRVVELAGIGPGPHACMMLADLGADVIRIDRPQGPQLGGGAHDLLARGRPSVALDLKHPAALAVVLDLVERAEVLIEGMRPGVAERLGLGPEACLTRNPALVYGRMTGWGQDGPLASAAGHDLTYLAISGVLHGLGQDPSRPHFPVNLLGDFGGGATYLVAGVLAALLEARTSGAGQVVDAAIVDGATHLSTLLVGLSRAGMHSERRGSNALDGGAPFYDVYATSDGRHVAVAALEPQFFAALVRLLGIEESCPGQEELGRYDEMRALFAEVIATRTMAEWAELAEGTDACLAPVLTPSEAAGHPHLRERETWVEQDGVVQPAPAPRFGRTAARLGTPPPASPGRDTRQALEAWGIGGIDLLLDSGAAVQS